MMTRGLSLACPVSLGCHHSKVQSQTSAVNDGNAHFPIVKESALGIEVILEENQSEERTEIKNDRIECRTEDVEGIIQASCVEKLNTAPPDQPVLSLVAKEKLSNKDPLSNLPPSLNRNYLDFPFFTDKKTIRHIRKGKAKIMFIMRGLSGSGKSSIVETLKSTYQDTVVCSADNFFMNENGEYVFDVAKLSNAHGYCQRMAKSSCEKGTSIVIIDNTNVKRWEMKFYLETAKLFGYVAVLVEPKTEWKFNPEVLALRNKHGVPIEILHKKVDTFDHVIPLYYGWFLSQRKSDLLRSLFSKVFSDCLDKFPDFQRELLSELGVRNSGRVSPDTSKGILLGYYSEQGKTSPLLHCTSRFCGGGKASGGEKYDSRKDVQSSCGQVFRLTLTGLIMTKKTCGVRVTLSEKCLSLFERPEEAEWVSRVSSTTSTSNGNSKRGADSTSLSATSLRSLASPSNNSNEWKVVNKKGDKKVKAEIGSKRLKKRMAKERKKMELENWFNSNNDDTDELEEVVGDSKSKSKSSLSDMMNARIAEKKHNEEACGGSGDNDIDNNDDDDDECVDNDDDKNVGSNSIIKSELFLSNDQIQEALDSNSNPKLSVAELFPQLRNTGFARCAHITLKTANNVSSVETNLDVLHACDIENSRNDDFNSADFVSVSKGRAFYFGDGICCVYFDEPIKMDTVFSGYY